MKNTVRVIEVQSGEILFSTSIESIEKAYDAATIFEKMDIDFRIEAPSLPETLLRNLGKLDEEIEILNVEISAECESHN